MRTASHTANIINDFDPDAVFIDGVGVGAGVVDRLRELKYSIIEVQGGRTATQPQKYYNKRTEMWCLMRDWLNAGGGVPTDRELQDHLCAPEYGYTPTSQTQLETKKDLKERLGESPDCGDALAMTFAEPVYARHHIVSAAKSFSKFKYDVLEHT